MNNDAIRVPLSRRKPSDQRDVLGWNKRASL